MLTPENVGRKTMEANRRAKSGRKSGIFVMIAGVAFILLAGV